MALQYIKHGQIDKTAWNKALNESKKPLMYASASYLDIVSPEWNAIVNDDYRWIFPVPAKSKFFIPYCYTPALVQQLGFFGPEVPTQNEVLQCFEMIKKKFLRINLSMQHLPVIPVSHLQVIPNLVLPLTSKYESLYAGFSENHRRNIRKSEESALELRKDVSVNDLLRLMRENPFKFTKKFMQQVESYLPGIDAIEEKNFRVMKQGVYLNNTLLCGALLILFHNRLTFLFSANSNDGKLHQAMFFLFNEVCREFQQHDIVLDFEGSKDTGTARFYKGFGAVPENFIQWVFR